MTIKNIGKTAHEVNKNNGWDVFQPSDWPSKLSKDNIRFLCTHTALIHTEVAEATEAIRNRDKENFIEELADTVIRIASIAHGLGVDLGPVIKKKIKKNSTRGLHHGGKAI